MIRKTLSVKLMLVLTSILLLVAALIFAANYQYQSQSEHDAFEEQVEGQIRLAISALRQPVFSYDLPQIEAIAQSLADTPLVHSIEVRDHRDKALGSASDEGESGNLMHRQGIEIHRDDKLIGRLDLAVSPAQMESVLAGQVQTTLITVVLLLLAALVTVAVLVKRMIARPVTEISRSLGDIAQGGGDLTRRLPIRGEDEVTELADNFNRVMEHIADLIRRIDTTAEQVADHSTRMNQASDSTATSIADQVRDIEQVVTALQEMSHSAEEVAEHARTGAENTETAMTQTEEGAELVRRSHRTAEQLSEQIQRTAEKVASLKNSSDRIGSVMEVIRTIAEQTNLLALNAAIEAARAGDQGRGFAVVADEVRSLAQKTQKSTEEIEAIIEELQGASEDSHHSMEYSVEAVRETLTMSDRVSQSLEQIRSSVSTINDMNHHIASASTEQSSVAGEVSQSMTRIQDVTEQLSQDAQVVRESSTELDRESHTLRDELRQFRT